MADWLWAVMFVCGLALGAVLGYTLLRQRDEQRERRQEETMRDSFDRLAQKALNEVLDRNAAQQDERLDGTLRPMRDTLKQTREKLNEIENKRHEHYGSLEAKLEKAGQDQEKLRQETNKLSGALLKPDVRGHWGEIKLDRLLELAGMEQGRDFDKQVQTEGGRPDVVVRMPGNRNLVIDAKSPLVAYQDALREQDPKLRQKHLETYADQMRQMVLDLEKKKYWTQIENTLDFIVMFVPADHLLDAALEQKPQLMEDAFKKKILLTTPSSLMAVLRIVEHCWKQQKLTENAEEIRDLGNKLVEHAASFLKHMETFRSNLNKCVTAYDTATGSWRRGVHPTLKKFQELGISGEALEPPAKLETHAEKTFPAPPARDDAD